MLESSGGLVGSSGEGSGKAVVGSNATSIMAAGSIGGGGEDDKSGGELFESGGGGGGNRWPRQETLALLKIRSDMDTAFRDSSLKGPLWEEVSRKMAELGYHRSGKKCKEKFENVYKYHKRTKEGRVGKSEGKTYRFFDQLEALEQHHPNSSSALPPPRAPPQVAVPVTMVMPAGVTVPSSPQPINVIHVASAPLSISPHPQQPPPPQNVSSNNPTPANQVAQTQGGVQGQQQQAMPTHPSPIQMEHSAPSESPSATPSSSSSTSSDEEVMGRRKRKRKWKDFFERLMKDVIDKQEDLQKRFLEAVEKREHDRMAREEGWKMQEIARLNREHEILVQERSMAAAKDAALISFLKKLSEQQHIPIQLPPQLQTPAQPPQPQPQDLPSTTTGTQSQQRQQQAQAQAQAQAQPQSQPQAQVHHNPVPVAPVALPQPQPLTQFPPQQVVSAAQTQLVMSNNVDLQKTNNGNGNGTGGDVQSPLPPGSSRWPKAEVQALINLRTNLDQKYQESGPKGPLWEEISASMRKLGYNRSSKRCKEKWENINKYFKKVKESNKKRPEDSKTCPYFHQLDALYREKNRHDPNPNTNTNSTNITSSYGHPSSNVNLGPIVAQTQQQWPNPGSDNADHEDSDDDGDEEDDDDQGTGYEIVANHAAGATNANVNVNANAGSISTTNTTATTTGHAE